ncbi:hypothetical protein QEN19_003433 [Hanseniaspora menglaensis]
MDYKTNPNIKPENIIDKVLPLNMSDSKFKKQMDNSESPSSSSYGSSMQQISKSCDACRENNMQCSGTLPCTNCAKIQVGSDTIECTYNYEIKTKLNKTIRKSNKQIYTQLKEKLDSLEQTLKNLDVDKLNKILSVSETNKKVNGVKPSINDDETRFINGLFTEIAKKKENVKIKRMGIRSKDIHGSVNSNSNELFQKQDSMQNERLGRIFLQEEGQIEQNKSSFKLFFYLLPQNIQELLFKKFNFDSTDLNNIVYKKIMTITDNILKLNTLMQKDNEIYIKEVFEADLSKNIRHQIIHKIPSYIISYTINQVEFRQENSFVFYQSGSLRLLKLFEALNEEASDDGYVYLKGKVTVPEMNSILTMLLNSCKFYMEKAPNKKVFDDLVFWDNILLKYVIFFYKSFVANSKIETKIEDNFYNIQTLIQLAFYVENSPAPRMATSIIAKCISYIQVLHYDDCEYLNQLLPDSDQDLNDGESIVNSLKFQIQAAYLKCYFVDKTLSLRCHKPEMLNNKDEAFNIMQYQLRDLIKFYKFEHLLSKEQLSGDVDINILDENSLLFNNFFSTAAGSYIIITQLKLRVAHLHSIAYKYLIAVSNENDSLEVVVEKKNLVLERLSLFKSEACGMFSVDKHIPCKKIIKILDITLKNEKDYVRESIKWQYIFSCLEFYTLLIAIHLSDFEILQHIETKENIERAVEYCKNPELIDAVVGSLDTAAISLKFEEFYKFDSGSVAFCAFTNISAAFNISLFNKDFLKQNIHKIIAVIKVITTQSLKPGFIDPLKWSAISILGISCVKILFMLYQDLFENELKMNFNTIFQKDFDNSVSTLTRITKEIISSVGKCSYDYKKKFETQFKVKSESTYEDYFNVPSNASPLTPGMRNINFDFSIKTALSDNSVPVYSAQLESSSGEEDRTSSDVHVDFEKIFDNEILQLFEKMGSAFKTNDVFSDTVVEGQNLTPGPSFRAYQHKEDLSQQVFTSNGSIFSNNNYGMEEFFEDDLFQQFVVQK